MPTYRSITLHLHSQFDISIFPEYTPLPATHYASYISQHVHTPPTPPLPVDETDSTCSVYIATFPGSTFWLSYAVAQPVPPDQHFLFKLFVNKKHVVSWSTGREEEWTGKTMFGLFERTDEEDGKKRIEKRALKFTSEDGEWQDIKNTFDPDTNMEIRVHRASGRKRVGWGTEQYKETEHGKKPSGIELANAGRAGGGHPKRFYKFALIDSTDQPFATFRYYYRTWEQLRYLGLIEGDSDVDLSVIEPCEPCEPKALDLEGEEECDMVSLKQGLIDVDLEEDGENRAPTPYTQTYVPTGASHADARSSDDRPESQHSYRHSSVTTPPRFYQLSVPPALKLEPTQHSFRPLPLIPRKADSSSDLTAYRPHPAYPVENWVSSTPSSVKSIRDMISTPPLLGRKKAYAPSSLVNAITNVWKRRRIPSGEFSSGGTDSRSSSRSVVDVSLFSASREHIILNVDSDQKARDSD